MNKLIISILLLPLFGCGENTQFSTTQPQKVVQVEEVALIDSSFDILFQTEKIGQGRFRLATTIELSDSSYVISPYSQDNVYGHINISLRDHRNLIVGESLQEIPNSVEEYDPILEEPVRFVRENTTYQQALQIVKDEDFDISGSVWFVLEPSCVPYEVEFIISYHAGEMTIEKTNTRTAYGVREQ